MKMKKKGQMLSQPFVYIFALVVGALILVWGGKTVLDLVNTGSQVNVGSYIESLESDVAAYKNFGEGSKTSKKVDFPQDITYICFLDLEKNPTDCQRKEAGNKIVKCKPAELDEDFAFQIEVPNKNIYVLPLSAVKINSFLVEDLKPKLGNPFCVRNGQDIIIESMVDHVVVS